MNPLSPKDCTKCAGLHCNECHPIIYSSDCDNSLWKCPKKCLQPISPLFPRLSEIKKHFREVICHKCKKLGSIPLARIKLKECKLCEECFEEWFNAIIKSTEVIENKIKVGFIGRTWNKIISFLWN